MLAGRTRPRGADHSARANSVDQRPGEHGEQQSHPCPDAQYEARVRNRESANLDEEECRNGKVDSRASAVEGDERPAIGCSCPFGQVHRAPRDA